MRCTEKKPDGKRCKVFALVGEELCLFHSSSKKAKEIRARRNPKRILSNEELVIILQLELKKVKRSKNDEYRLGETRRIIELISELKGERPPASNGKKSSSFEDRVKKAKMRLQDES